MHSLKIPEYSKDPVINITLDTLSNNKQILIFAGSKKSAEKIAEDVSKAIQSVKNGELAEVALSSLPHPTKQCERLSVCLKKGIAFHHAGLHSKQRELIEENFHKGAIKVIAATPTLAIGIDMPAFRTLIKDLKRFSGLGSNYIPVLEYLQMAGRAGRPGMEDYGEAIILATSDVQEKELHKRYILGEPEEIYSKLAVEPVLRTYILTFIATEIAKSKKKMLDILKKTFWAYQFMDMLKLESIVEKMLTLLQDYQFIVCKNELRSILDDEEYLATTLGKRVSELYLDPLTGNHLLVCLQRYSERNDFALLHMFASTLEMRPYLRVKTKELAMIKTEWMKCEKMLVDEPDAYDPEFDEFLDTLKTALCFQEWINERDEDYLLTSLDIRPGELKAKLDILDWLIHSAMELCMITQQRNIYHDLSVLRTRLSYGAKQELLPLLQLKNIGRVRARILFSNNIRSLADVKKIDPSSLGSLIGKQVAMNIKEQVGQEVTIVTDHKRKGQISLKDF